MKPKIQFSLVVAMLALAAIAYGTDYSSMYDRDTLQRAYQTYSQNLRGVWQEDLLGRLTTAEQQAAHGIKLDLPLIGASRRPFEFYASASSRTVTIPILSVKFFDEIATASAWLEQKGCEPLTVSDYAGMIAYRSPSAFPGGRYPTPLEAIGVPSNALDNNFVNDVSGKNLKSAIYFLMAHELAHILYKHRGNYEVPAAVSREQERQADAFAINVMRRIAVPPMGMSVFFTVASRFEPAPGDFGSMEAYERRLRELGTHPLTSDRLIAVAQGIRNNVDSFIRAQPSPLLWRPRMLDLAGTIENIGRTLDDREIREYQRMRSLQLTYAHLRSACR